MKNSKWGRKLLILASGGLLFQSTGCDTTIAPLVLSLAEQLVLSSLFGGIAIERLSVPTLTTSVGSGAWGCVGTFATGSCPSPHPVLQASRPIADGRLQVPRSTAGYGLGARGPEQSLLLSLFAVRVEQLEELAGS